MKKTILLVEDSKLQKLVCEKILHRAGYLLLFAADGEEGLRLIQECIPDLILLDLLLPGIGGEEVLLALKRNTRTEPIPVIVLSGVPPSRSTELMAAGAADYFEKSRLTQRDGEAALLAAIDAALRESERVNGVRRYKPLAAGT